MLLVPLGSWWRGVTVVMGVTAWVSRMVGAPAVPRSPGSQGTTAMLRGVAGWGEPGSRAHCAVTWFPMTTGTTELNQEAIGVSAPPQSWEGARSSGADTASALLPSQAVLWGCALSSPPHQLGLWAQLQQPGELHWQAPSLSFPSCLFTHSNTPSFGCTACGSLRHASVLSRGTLVDL